MAAQWRFMVARPTSGLSGETSQRAKRSRLRGRSFGSAGSTASPSGSARSGGRRDRPRLEELTAVVDEGGPRVLGGSLLHDERGRQPGYLLAQLVDGFALRGHLGGRQHVVPQERRVAVLRFLVAQRSLDIGRQIDGDRV